MEDRRGRRRALAEATEAPIKACDTSHANWPAGAEAICNSDAHINYGVVYSMTDLQRMCLSDACLSIAAAMRAANPSECTMGFQLRLYANFLNRLDDTCAHMDVPQDSDGEDNSATQPPSPAKTTTAKPSTDTSAKKTPAPKKVTSNSTTTTIVVDAGSSGSLASSEGSSERDPSKSVAPERGSHSGSSSSSSWSTFGSTSSDATDTNSLPPSNGKTKAPNGNIDAAQNTSSRSSSSSGVTVGAIVAVVVCIVLAVVFVLRRRRQAATQPDKSAASPAIETGRYRSEDATYATLDSSDHDTSTGELMHSTTLHSSRLVRADLAPLLEPLVPWQIDSSELTDVSLIGSGAQGAVYLVQLNAARLLVSKRLVPDQLTERKLKSLIAEIHLVATLQHPSIVGFVGAAWSSPFNLQALFEYMPNGDLRSYLDQHKPSQSEAQASVWDKAKLEIALAIAEGLAYVHSFNPPIVHRDLKARNILLDDTFSAKISDFGVSRLQSEDGTMTTGIGTSRWLAPEVIAGGGAYTEQCDIYSFGVVLVEMDTHALPFATVDGSGSEVMLLRQVSRGEVRPTVSPACDPRVSALVDWCLQQDPHKRPNALELSFELRQMIKSDRVTHQ